MTQPIGKTSLTDSKTTMSLASTPPAPGASPGASITDLGKSLKKLSDFSSRKLRAEKEDKARLLNYLVKAKHVHKVQSSVKYGLRTSPVLSDFLEKAHEMWQKDKQEEEESEDENEDEDYLPPLPAFKITIKNKCTYLGAYVFLVKEFKQGAEVSSRKRKHGEIQGTDDLGTDSKQPGRNIKQKAILQQDEMARQTPYPIKSMLRMSRSGIRFGSPVGNPLLQNQKEFEKNTYNITQRRLEASCL